VADFTKISVFMLDSYLRVHRLRNTIAMDNIEKIILSTY